MRYFYNYKYKNGCEIGGHNLEKIEMKKNLIKLSGVDIINYVGESEEQHWSVVLDMDEIEYLTIRTMVEEDEQRNKRTYINMD